MVMFQAGTEGWLMEGRLQIDNETRKKIYDKMAYRVLKQQVGFFVVRRGLGEVCRQEQTLLGLPQRKRDIVCETTSCPN